VRLPDDPRQGQRRLAGRPLLARCGRCGHVDYTLRWFQAGWRCPNLAGCPGEECDLLPATEEELRAFRAARGRRDTPTAG
jgi:hypothetical protein